MFVTFLMHDYFTKIITVLHGFSRNKKTNMNVPKVSYFLLGDAHETILTNI